MNWEELIKNASLVFKLAGIGYQWVQAERARTGKTIEQIIEDTDTRLDKNEKRLLAKLNK